MTYSTGEIHQYQKFMYLLNGLSKDIYFIFSDTCTLDGWENATLALAYLPDIMLNMYVKYNYLFYRI